MLWCKNKAKAECVSLLLAPFSQAQPPSYSRTSPGHRARVTPPPLPRAAAPSAWFTTLQTTSITYRVISHRVLSSIIMKKLRFYTIKHLIHQNSSLFCIFNRSISSLLLLSPTLPRKRQKWTFIYSQHQPQAALLLPDRKVKGSTLGTDGEVEKAAGFLCRYPSERQCRQRIPTKDQGVDANTAEALTWNVAPTHLHLCSAKPSCTPQAAQIILHPPATQGLNQGRKKQNSQGISQAAEEAGQRLGEVVGTWAEALQDRNLMQKQAASVTKVSAAHQEVYNLGSGEREA